MKFRMFGFLDEPGMREKISKTFAQPCVSSKVTLCDIVKMEYVHGDKRLKVLIPLCKTGFFRYWRLKLENWHSILPGWCEEGMVIIK